MLLLRHAIGWNFRQNRISDVRINEACSRIESWSFSFPKRPTRRELTPNVDLEKGQGHCHRRSSDTVAYLPMSRSTAPTSYNTDELQHRRITTSTSYNMGDSGNPYAIRCNADLTRAIVYSGLGLTCFDSLVE